MQHMICVSIFEKKQLSGSYISKRKWIDKQLDKYNLFIFNKEKKRKGRMKSDRRAKTDEFKALDRCFFQTIYQTHQRHAKSVTPLILLTIPTSVQLTVHHL